MIIGKVRMSAPIDSREYKMRMVICPRCQSAIGSFNLQTFAGSEAATERQMRAMHDRDAHGISAPSETA